MILAEGTSNKLSFIRSNDFPFTKHMIHFYPLPLRASFWMDFMHVLLGQIKKSMLRVTCFFSHPLPISSALAIAINGLQRKIIVYFLKPYMIPIYSLIGFPKY